jgi:hypothetical protein
MKIIKENLPDILAFVEVSLFFVPAEGFSTKYFPDDEPSVLFLVFGKL